jgi:DNA-binding NarL/FixJ family response regulator
MSKRSIVIGSTSKTVSQIVMRSISGPVPGNYIFSGIHREQEFEEKLPALESAFIFIGATFCRSATANAVAGYLKLYPCHRLAVFSQSDSPPHSFVHFLYWGVERFINFRDSEEELRKGLSLILAGGCYVPGKLRELAEDYEAVPAATPFLTSRELEITRLIARGLTAREIARTLGRSPKTINNHKSLIFQKCSVHGTMGLVRFALNRHIIQAEELKN